MRPVEEKPKYLLGLGFYRLILAWMVIACHTTGYYDLTNFDSGTVAVSTFFFISGYLMPLTYNNNYLKYSWINGSKKFYLNRIIRIYPIYLATIIFVIFQSGLNSIMHRSWEGIFKAPLIPISSWFQNILLFGLNQSTLWGGYFRFNNPAWTLDIELQYYLLVPALIYIFNKSKFWAISLMLLVSIAGVWIYFHPFNLVDIDRSFVSWSFFFIGGFFFNLCKTDLYKIIRLALVLGIITLYLALYASIDSIVGLRTFLFSVVFIFVSLPLLIVQKNYQFTSLDKKLGDLSYPTYIIHIFILTYTDKIVSLVREFMFNGAFTFAITFGINLLLTTITSMILLRVIADPIEAFRNRIRGAAI